MQFGSRGVGAQRGCARAFACSVLYVGGVSSTDVVVSKGQNHLVDLRATALVMIAAFIACAMHMAASASRRAPMPVPTSRVGSPPVDLSSGVSSGARLQQHCKRGGAAGPPWCGC